MISFVTCFIPKFLNNLCLFSQVHIEIGSQTDVEFLHNLCERYGPFDIIIDDGGHKASQMMISLRTLFPCVIDAGYYVIEDTHVIASNNPAATHFEGKNIAEHMASIYASTHYYFVDFFGGKEVVGETHLFDPIFSHTVKSIRMDDSIITLERRKNQTQPMTRIEQGNMRIPFTTTASIEVANDSNPDVIETFTTFVAESSETFTQDERRRLYDKCLAFCASSSVSAETSLPPVRIVSCLMPSITLSKLPRRLLRTYLK